MKYPMMVKKQVLAHYNKMEMPKVASSEMVDQKFEALVDKWKTQASHLSVEELETEISDLGVIIQGLEEGSADYYHCLILQEMYQSVMKGK